MDPIAARNHQRPDLLVQAGVRVWVQNMCDIAGLNGIRVNGHQWLQKKKRRLSPRGGKEPLLGVSQALSRTGTRRTDSGNM
jgi:hypothetical protein